MRQSSVCENSGRYSEHKPNFECQQGCGCEVQKKYSLSSSLWREILNNGAGYKLQTDTIESCKTGNLTNIRPVSFYRRQTSKTQFFIHKSEYEEN